MPTCIYGNGESELVAELLFVLFFSSAQTTTVSRGKLDGRLPADTTQSSGRTIKKALSWTLRLADNGAGLCCRGNVCWTGINGQMKAVGNPRWWETGILMWDGCFIRKSNHFNCFLFKCHCSPLDAGYRSTSNTIQNAFVCESNFGRLHQACFIFFLKLVIWIYSL